MRRILHAVESFFLAPGSARPVAALRIGLALVLLAQALSFAGNLLDLYGPLGIIQWDVDPLGKYDYVPSLDRVAQWLAPLGVTPDAVVRGIFFLYLLSLVALLAGWQSRLAAFLAWLTHLALLSSGNSAYYGVDDLANIALFYCIWMPVGRAWSLDAPGASETPSWEATLSLRVLQIHLCVVYFSSGIVKATGEQWWNGEAIWRALMREDFAVFDMAWLAGHTWIAQLACWGTLAVEVFYPLFIWLPWTRRAWLLATVSLHLGIALFLGLVSFAALMIVLNVAAFGVSGRPANAARDEVARDGAGSANVAA